VRELATLVAFFVRHEDALEARQALRRRGFRRTFLVQKTAEGEIHKRGYARRTWILHGFLGGVFLGLLVGLLLHYLAPALLRISVYLSTGILVLLLGLFGTLIARWLDLGVESRLQERCVRWPVMEESLILLRAEPEALAWAIPVLRGAAEMQPAIFALETSSLIQPGEFPAVVPLSPAQIQDHARRLAATHTIGPPSRGHGAALLARIIQSGQTLQQVCDDLAQYERLEQSITASAEWLLDNAYIMQSHIRDVGLNLPRRFYEELPILSSGPQRGDPRVYGLASDLVLHTDARLDRSNIGDFLQAYQSVSPLSIGELWALPMMLRITIIDRLRELALQVLRRFHEAVQADFWANRLLTTARRDASQLFNVLAELAKEQPQPSAFFATQLIGHLYDEQAALVPVRSWLERSLQTELGEINRREQARQAAMQISIGNAITSLRQLSLLDWREIFERHSRTEEILRRDPAGVYPHMDFDTRDRYRRAVEQIARGARIPETEVAELAIETASNKVESKAADFRRNHIGTYLIGSGRKKFVRELGGREKLRRRFLHWIKRNHTVLYLSAVGLTSAVLVGIAVALSYLVGEHSGWLILGGLLSALPASQLAIQIVNYWFTRLLAPIPLPKMSFEEEGIPDEFRTLVVVPVLWVDERTIGEEIDKLEIRYLANPHPNLLFGLFGDFMDANEPTTEQDEALLGRAVAGIEALNRRHGAGRFYLFHRERAWCESEGKFIGKERKRGKLELLNRLIDGEELEEDIVRVGRAEAMANVRFVITLDSDTQLPRDSARRLIETIAHPLNRPTVVAEKPLRVDGYGIIQPRISTALPSATATVFTRLFTDPIGTDPYTKAVSDVYQDLASEGSYVGKAIYDPRFFNRVMKNRLPEERILSHDLIEGAHVRVGYASDIELYDDFPGDYMSYARRQHRWIRGDWQIAEWILPRVPSGSGKRVPNPLSILNRWKVFDNLRRSLVPVSLMLYLLVTWLISPVLGGVSTLLVGGLMLFQPLVQPVTWMTTSPGSANFTLQEVWHGVRRSLVEAALIPHQTGVALDAILRVWYRRLVSHHHFLEWTTAQMTGWRTTDRARSFSNTLGVVSLFSIAVGILVWQVQPISLYAAVPFLMLWFFSPWIGWRLNQGPDRETTQQQVSRRTRRRIRKWTRRTWAYFEDFVTEKTNWLPPDNFQVSHQNHIADRTSPTNIGLWVLSALGAHDCGYLSADSVIEQVNATMKTLDRLEKYEGHLLNWYNIETLEPLEPRYVSTVDSGNLLGCLWTLEIGIGELLDAPLLDPVILHGAWDTLDILRDILKSSRPDDPHMQTFNKLAQTLESSPGNLEELIRAIRHASGLSIALSYGLRRSAGTGDGAAYWAGKLERQISQWIHTVDRYMKWAEILTIEAEEVLAPLGTETLDTRRHALREAPSLRDLAAGAVPVMQAIETSIQSNGSLPPSLTEWIERLRDSFSEARWFAGEILGQGEELLDATRELARNMNMRFLYDPDRRLFTIGYNVSNQRRDESYYDLLASESRLGSFVAIARGDVPSEHWLALNRPYGSVGNHRLLLSWTGTMFEYLMPLLLQRTYSNSLLDLATHEAVELQRQYADQRNIPWGISESAYGDLDVNKTYQYKAFGVPGLGLKRGLEEDLVVAPYASMLALMVEPNQAAQNLRRLASEGLQSRYGFYEAIDFTRQRRREGERGILVRAYMAHHQAMGFLAMVNLLHDNSMQRRFHEDRRVQATEPLLYERIPVAPPIYEVSTRERPTTRATTAELAPSVSKFDTAQTTTPRTHLLSNGNMDLMITNAGGGYSQWKDFELTRWRADTTRDAWGSFCYLRDVDNGRIWSNTYQPVGGEPDNYSINMAIDRAEFRRRDNGIDTETEIVVSPEDDVEIRRMTFINRSNRARRIEITSYIELSMAPHDADRQHPAFNKMFIQTEALPQVDGLLAFRRLRDPDDTPIFVAHRLTLENGESSLMQYETDRSRFIGRGRSTANPIALEGDLSNRKGFVLDPILSIRKLVTIRPRQRLSVSMLLAASNEREQVVRLMEKYGDPRAITRSLEMAWVHAQLELRLLRIQPDDARRFQQLASAMLYPDAWLRPPPERLEQNHLGQSGLWPYGISGDLPIAVVSVGEARDLSTVRQMLQAHTFWRQHGLKSDLIILNEEASSYEKPLNERLQNLIETNSIYTTVDQPGGVYLRSVDQIPEDHLTLILSAARVALVAARGPLSQQLGVTRESPDLPTELVPRKIQEEPSAPLPFMELPYFNGLGGFTPDGHEYAVYLGPEDNTPAPWVNVLANPKFGALISESGSGFVWYGNSQQNRLTGWSNDAVSDPASDAIYIRDEDSGTFWTPTPRPIRELDAYRARHGAGYSVFEHNSHAIEQELVTFVPMSDQGGEPVRIQRLRLHNDSTQSRRLSVTFYADLVLGEVREENQMHVITKWDEDTNVLMAYNRYHPDYADRVVFIAMSPAADDYTADRTAFMGRNQSLANPTAMHRSQLSQRVGAGLDPCAAMRVMIELEPGQRDEINIMLGSADSLEEAGRIIRHFRGDTRVDEALHETSGWWDKFLGRLQVSHPELSVEFLLNRWLLYQTLSCRIFARSAFYQSGGAFGFRDQLQDVMAILHAAPQFAREHILRAAVRQFKAGDVQHWWHPASGAGVRTRISDDLLWLPYVVNQYVRVTGDFDILEEQLPFLDGRKLQDDENEIYLVPEVSSERASLYEHCRRAIEFGATSGPHELPLIGTGDWNDGLNRVGVEGKGESVWLAWFLIDILDGFADLAEETGRQDEAADFRKRATRLAENVEKEAWDGAWYLRATYDDGTPLGSARNVEARIDSLPQSWALICGAADPDRSKTALESVWEQLVREKDRLVLLFTPPFDRSVQNPGYIAGYPPGVRENGGQYTHAAVWLAIAYARMGDGEHAAQILRMLNPIEHTREPQDVDRYTVEPYVLAADVYNLTGKVGRGGWTWYTGSAGWMYRAWVEEILGLKVRGDVLRVDPVIPAAWDDFNIRYSYREAVYELKVENPDHVGQGVAWIEMDGRRLDKPMLSLDGSAVKHKVVVRMGIQEDSNSKKQKDSAEPAESGDD